MLGADALHAALPRSLPRWQSLWPALPVIPWDHAADRAMLP
jgi:hypothetical protein